MATGDPGYCFEHKCWYAVCERERHSWETEEDYEARIKAQSHNCPSCNCSPPAELLMQPGWRL